MANYLYAFILAAVAAVVVEMLSPAGEGGRLGGLVRLVAGLCMLVMLVNPLQEGIALLRSVADGSLEWSWEGDEPGDENDYQDIWQEELASLGRRETAAWVTAELESRFGIAKENHTVQVTMTETDGEELPKVAGVNILLHGWSVFENPHQIEKYITDRLGCPCSVAIQ